MDINKINQNAILKLTFEFSLSIIDFCEALEQKIKFVISNQLLKSVTSFGANCFGAQNCESKADFVHKLKIAAKKLKKQDTGSCYVNSQNTIPILIFY